MRPFLFASDEGNKIQKEHHFVVSSPPIKEKKPKNKKEDEINGEKQKKKKKEKTKASDSRYNHSSSLEDRIHLSSGIKYIFLSTY